MITFFTRTLKDIDTFSLQKLVQEKDGKKGETAVKKDWFKTY